MTDYQFYMLLATAAGPVVALGVGAAQCLLIFSGLRQMQAASRARAVARGNHDGHGIAALGNHGGYGIAALGNHDGYGIATRANHGGSRGDDGGFGEATRRKHGRAQRTHPPHRKRDRVIPPQGGVISNRHPVALKIPPVAEDNPSVASNPLVALSRRIRP